MGVENAPVNVRSGMTGPESSTAGKASILQQIRMQNAANMATDSSASLSTTEPAPKLERKRGIGAVAFAVTDYRTGSSQAAGNGSGSLEDSSERDASAREAYEVWKEFMRERKRAILNR
jgi:hypothetical protein